MCVILTIACNTRTGIAPVNSSTTTSDSVRFVEPKFFYVVTDTVKPGYTAWGRAKVYFGKNESWRDVVARNPILQMPGKVYLDPSSGIWYCMMKTGEVLFTGDTTKLNPVFTDTIPKAKVPISQKGEKDGFWQGLALMFAILAFILFMTFVLGYPKKNLDPVTGGVPQVPGGVNDGGAQGRINEIARSQFGESAKINVRNIRRGRLSGHGMVHYANQASGQSRVLNNVIGYAGEITVDGKEKTVYFLQGCGNDVRKGEYLTDLIFVADADIPVVVEQSEANRGEKPNAATPTTDLVTKHSVTESTSPTMKALSIIEEHIKNGSNEKHKMVFNLKPDGSIEFTVDYKYKEPKEPKAAQKEEEKKA